MRVLEGEMERVRLRVAFENHHILSKSQRKEGLAKSWILFNPKLHTTISDISAYLLRIFRLHHSCPHGLLLSMDGFVLPPFESTCVLKDKDIVCVRKKGGVSAEIDKLDNGLEIVKLLANEEFTNEIDGYESELEEDEHEEYLGALDLEDTPDVDKVSKKRKASKKLQGSKRKKSKLVCAKESPDLEDVENDGRVVKSGSSHHVLQKSRVKKDKSSDVHKEPEKSSTPEIDETTNFITKCMPKAKRFCELQENDKGSADVSSMPVGTEKLPSRSARRKKAKRRWLREQAKTEKMEKQVLPKDNPQSLDRDDKKHEHQQPDETSCDKDNEKISKAQQPDSSSGADEDVVPVVIRPGHIRFEVPGKGDAVQAVQQNHTPVETFQWNGIISKKKGQKWGTEKAAFSKKNYENYSEDYSAMLATEEEIPVNNCKDLVFDNLRPYTSLPKEDDVIAYRLIELSSSWTPEPTSFRIGKISWYDSESNKIMLVPVPEYPLDIEKKIDEDESAEQSDISHYGSAEQSDISHYESAEQSDISHYGEDGSLQIDFSLLIDARIVKHGNSNNAKSVTAGVNEVSVEDRDATTKLRDNNNNEGSHTPTQENGKVNAWEEIDQVLSAKKAELSQVDDRSTNENSGRSRLSYRALRSSALGPTMALLRAQNEF